MKKITKKYALFCNFAKKWGIFSTIPALRWCSKRHKNGTASLSLKWRPLRCSATSLLTDGEVDVQETRCIAGSGSWCSRISSALKGEKVRFHRLSDALPGWIYSGWRGGDYPGWCCQHFRQFCIMLFCGEKLCSNLSTGRTVTNVL